ncbi:MAG TPA: protein kinase [Thermoanaerobaculia bacterium]|jgi:Tol biopolymer transport system component
MEQLKRADSPGEAVRSEPFPAGTTIARYRLLSFIGSGAMGDVYRAHDRGLDREVALKVLPPELVGDRERVRRFAQEARAASALSHPHIVTIHEVGHARPALSVRAIGERPARAGEVHYIAMEYVEGETLRDALSHATPLRRTVELLAQVADGLGKAHAAGIIHRDLKPDNILVARDGYAKIVDFGLAKLIDTTWNPIGADSPTLRALTAHGELLGTPGYMAPEQIGGKMLDARADVFSFGCILYEAVAGTRAFEAESFVDTLYKIMHEQPAPLPAETDPELQRIVEKCLEKDREQRYQSIREVASDLRRWLAASQPGVVVSMPRNDGRLLFASIVVAALFIACIVVGITMHRRGATVPVDASVRRITNDGRAMFATLSNDGRYLAYVSMDGKQQTLWVEQLGSGTRLAVVPPSNGHYAGVSFSPDGDSVYFSRYDLDPMAELSRVSILGGTARPILRDIDSRAAVSPDGKRLAFTRDDFNHGTSSLMLANADGSNVRALAVFQMPDRVMWPAWSPDGTRIVVTRNSDLVEVDAASGRSEVRKTSVRFAAFRGVAWPERARIIAAAATSSETAGRFRLWSIDGAGNATPLTSELTDLYAPVVAADGKTIAALQVIRQANLFEVTRDGMVKQLTTGIGAGNGLTGVVWAGDRVIYASSSDGKPDLWTLRPSTGETARLTEDEAVEAMPAVSPDGRFVVYLSQSQEQQTIWRMRPDGSERVQLSSGPRDWQFAISPDSRSLAWTSLDPQTNEWVLWTMPLQGPLQGGAKHRVTSRANVLEQVRYTADGRSLLFTGYERDKLHVYRVALSGGTPVMLLDDRASDAAVSPDGTTAAVIAGGFGGEHSGDLALVPLTGGRADVRKYGGMAYRWHPSGREISFVREHDLYVAPVAGGEPQRLTQFSDGAIAQYAWSKDGRHAVVAHAADSVDVVLIR